MNTDGIKKARWLDLAVKEWGLGLGGFFGGPGLNADAAPGFIEVNGAIDEGEERPIASGADIEAGVEFGSALADDDAAGGDDLTAEAFYAQTFADAVASVANTALTFLVCH